MHLIARVTRQLQRFWTLFCLGICLVILIPSLSLIEVVCVVMPDKPLATCEQWEDTISPSGGGFLFAVVTGGLTLWALIVRSRAR